MTLLREIQEATIDSQTTISTLLRKAKVLATRLQNPEFNQWVNEELNGYNDGASLPPYRILHVTVRGHMSSRGGYRQIPNASIMTTFLPEKFWAFGEISYLRGAISEYASLLETDGADFQVPWPQEMAMLYGAKGYQDMECLGAWQLLSRSQIVGVIEAVRNRVLDFALQIEAAAPNAGEAAPGSVPVPQERVTQVFSTVIMGGVNNVATGSANVTQTNLGQVNQGDFSSLADYLRTLGIPDNSIDELKKDLSDQGKDPKKTAESWIGKLALSGGTAAITYAIPLAVKAISAYFGLSVP